MEFFGNIIICSAALLAVISRDNIEGSIVGLSISYALQVSFDIYLYFLLVVYSRETKIEIVLYFINSQATKYAKGEQL